MRKHILLLIALLGMLPMGYAQNDIIDFEPLDSYSYFQSRSYPYSPSLSPLFTVRFTVEKEMMVRLCTCASTGMTGTESFLRGPDGEIRISDGCGGTNTGLTNATIRLYPGTYYWQVTVVAQKPGWLLDMAIEGSRPVPEEPDKKPLIIGTFFSDAEELFLENSTWDYPPMEGESGVAMFQFATVCPTDIFVNIDTQTRVVITTLEGQEIACLEGNTETVTLPKGQYLLLASFIDDSDGLLFFALDITLSEPFNIPKDTLLEDFPPLQQPVTPLTTDENYILTRSMLSIDGKRYKDIAQFYDGLGRPSQLLEKKTTPTGNSLVTLQEYDELGRASKKWLPVSTPAYYIAPDNIASDASAFYTDDSRPYELTEYEASPLSRVVSQYGAGISWQNKPLRNDYSVNGTSTELRCSDYYINNSNVLTRRGDYAVGQLYVTKVTDEDGNKSLTFTDKDGRVILMRQMDGATPHDTYYVYDNPGNLRYVLPPMIKDNVQSENLDLYAFQYKYDSWNRCIEKKMPGSNNLIKYVYDKSDRLILRQDANQALRNEWQFFLYDVLGREVIQGLCTSVSRPSFDDAVVKAKRTAGTGFGNTGYEIENFGYSPTALLSINYYDDYNFLDMAENMAYKTNLKYGFTDGATSDLYGAQYVNTDIPEVTARGLLTGTKTFLLGTTQSLLSSFYYDAYGNMIQSRSQNHLNGYEKDFFAYTFSKKLLRHLHVHSAENQPAQKEIYSYLYDAQSNDNPERLLKVTYQLNNASPITLVENEYDELGRICDKKIHNSMNCSEYKYNIRNWLSSIKNPKFTQHLYYNDGSGTQRYYNGNISSMTWQCGTDVLRGYKFTYDNLNRMQSAVYGEGAGITPPADKNFSENVTGYDYNGNITGLQRYGKLNGSTYGKIDDLSITYTGNQLNNVSDAAADPLYNGAFNFVDGNKTSVQEYKYDANGNLEQDFNKKIAKIQYNSLNLPSALQLANGNRTDYLYGADGMKRRVTHKTAIANISVPMGQIKELASNQISQTHTTDYCGNVIYENGTLSRILTEEGYVTLSGTTPTYHYYLKDHQGNNRVVINQSNTVEQVNHYYPFGGLFEVNTSTAGVQHYKYNGKELDRMHGLDWYDYGARHYDAVVGRFTTMDPLAEKYYGVSPYAYCANNPNNRIDPNGMDWYRVKNNDNEWEYTWDSDIHSQAELNNLNDAAFYLGKTYTDKNEIYYSLFGQTVDLKTKEGKATSKLDEAIINYVDFLKKSKYDDEIKQKQTDFDIGEYAKTSTLGLTEEIYFNFEYGLPNATGTVYYYLIGKGQMNKGTFESWSVADQYRTNANRGVGNMKAGYNLRFERSGGSNNNWCARIVFSTQMAKDNTYNIFRKIFFK